MKTDRRENVMFIVTNYKDRFTSQIATTYPNMFSFGLDYRLLFLRFLLLTLSICFFAGKDIAQKLLLF